jgi:CRISPR/Cas system-associated endonuclease Cas1
VEAVEAKLAIVKSVGKAKQLDADEVSMSQKYDNLDLKAKCQKCRSLAEAMIENGKLTHKELPEVLESLRTRLETAKANGKATLQEKLERLLAAAAKKTIQYFPVANIEEIAQKRKDYEDVEALNQRPWKSLTSDEQRQVTNKSTLALELAAVESKGIMWFETEEEYGPRVKLAVADYERTQVQRRQAEARRIKEEKEKAAELAFQKKIEEQDRLLEEKRLAAKEKEEQLEAELAAKLEAKRLEDLAKPQKEVAPVKKKEKVRKVKLDAKSLFLDKSQADIREEEDSDEAAI